MSKLLLAIVLLNFSMNGSGQQTNPVQPFNQTDFLEKSKKQKTAGWVVLGTGFAITTIGLVVGVHNASDQLVNLFSTTENKYNNTGEVLIYSGTAVMLASLPFFISSSKNRKKAANFSFNMKDVYLIQQQSVVKKMQPALVLKINL